MERKCSICGAKMELTSAGYMCTFCSNVEPANTKAPIHKPSMDGTAYTTVSSPSTNRQSGTYNNGTRSNGSNKTTNQKKKKSSILPGVILAIVGMMVLGFAMVFFPLLGMEMSRNSSQEKENNSWKNENKKGTETVAYEEVDGIQSGAIGQFVYRVFGKNAEELTEEELSMIQYIDLQDSWSDGVIDIRYSMADYRDYAPDMWDAVPEYNDPIPFAFTEEFKETIQTVSVNFLDGNSAVVYADLQQLKGLRALNLNSYTSINLSALPNLSMIICDGTDIATLQKSNVPTDQIEVLVAERIDLTGIKEFTALKRLYLEYNEFTQLEEVTACESLEELYCINMKGDKSYEILSKMPRLKKLYIDGSSDGVKDLSVLGQLTSLENLSIVDTEIISVDFLKTLTNLKVLRLSDNDKLEKMSALGELTNLEYLELDLDTLNGRQPEYQSIGHLKNLKKLALEVVYELDFLYELDQLEELIIDLTFYDYMLEPIRQMKNLESLTLLRCHSQFNDGFACLSELPNLKKLTVSNMEFDEKDPVDGLFALGNLEELHITHCSIYTAPYAVMVSDNLKVLDLAYTKFRVMPDYGEYMYVGYDDPIIFQAVLEPYFGATSLEELYLDYCLFTDLSGIGNLSNLKILSLNRCDLPELPGTDLAGCNSLQELYLASNQISDLSFAQNLPALEYIDLQDCYVTDLSPLRQCKQLKCVNAKNNPISSNPLLNVKVVTE